MRPAKAPLNPACPDRTGDRPPASFSPAPRKDANQVGVSRWTDRRVERYPMDLAGGCDKSVKRSRLSRRMARIINPLIQSRPLVPLHLGRWSFEEGGIIGCLQDAWQGQGRGATIAPIHPALQLPNQKTRGFRGRDLACSRKRGANSSASQGFLFQNLELGLLLSGVLVPQLRVCDTNCVRALKTWSPSCHEPTSSSPLKARLPW